MHVRYGLGDGEMRYGELFCRAGCFHQFSEGICTER
jgi:hypothetical protein